MATTAPAGRALPSRRIQASVAPVRATRKLTPAAPTQGSHRANGVSTVAQASRVHGKPPSGQADTAASTVTHTHAVHHGHPRSRDTSTMPTAARA